MGEIEKLVRGMDSVGDKVGGGGGYIGELKMPGKAVCVDCTRHSSAGRERERERWDEGGREGEGHFGK